jgi:hypothetical protein
VCLSVFLTWEIGSAVSRFSGSTSASGSSTSIVRDGFAWTHPRYDKPAQARKPIASEHQRGLWADPSPVPPWGDVVKSGVRRKASEMPDALRRAADNQSAEVALTDGLTGYPSCSAIVSRAMRANAAKLSLNRSSVTR